MIYVTQLQIRSQTFPGLGLKFHHQLVSITEQFACQTIKKNSLTWKFTLITSQDNLRNVKTELCQT